MLKGTRIRTNDSVWKNILTDLHAIISNDGIKFVAPIKKINACEIGNYVEHLQTKEIERMHATALSNTEQQLVLFLPASADELKIKLGYAPNSKTHTIETLIYNIRKKMGQDFIKLKNGRYEL